MDATSKHLGRHSTPQATGSNSEKTRLIFRKGYENFLFYKVSILALGAL